MKMVKLGKIANFINGRAFKPDEWGDVGLPIIRIQNLNDQTKPFNYFAGEFSENNIINNGDVLLSWSGTPGTSFGCFLWSRGRGVLNQHIFKVILDESICDKLYFIIAVNKNLDLLIDQAHGGVGLQHITKAKLVEIQIPLPPLPTQKKIAAILDAADEHRQKTKILIEKYDQLAQSLFLEMFGDPTNNEKRFVKTIIGEQCIVKGGKRVPKGENLVKENTGFPYIKAGNIKNGKVTTYDLEYLTIETHKKIKRYIVNEGDVCITVVGANIGDIGIVPKELHHANLTENANKLLIKDSLILCNIYLASYLQMDFVQKHIGKRTMAVGVPKLALFRIQQLELLLPPIALQNQFAERIQLIETQKQQAQASLQKAEDLFNSLLQRAFKGELVE